MATVGGPLVAADSVMPVNRVMESMPAASAHTVPAMPSTELGPSLLFTAKGDAKSTGVISSLVNSSIIQQSCVKVNVLRSSATKAVSQQGLPKCFVSSIRARPLVTFQGLVPVANVFPIQWGKLQLELATHPDQDMVAYVIQGLKDGFRLGFDPSKSKLKSASKNLQSSSLHPAVIDKYLQNEVENGRVAGPFSSPPMSNLQVNSFGVIPKRNQRGQWRLILDLSSPAGNSVNDGIPKDKFSVQYMKVDEVINAIMRLGRGTLVAKFDVQSAYRIVPIHPEDRHLLGMKWKNQFYVDMALPFGLRSAPYIFTSIADLVEWILKHNHGVDFLLHYLDDFHTLGPPSSQICQRNLDTCIQYFKEWSIPLHPDKLVGPSTCIVILGIELDTIKLQARLPKDKFELIMSLLASWSSKRHCTRKELESLIGYLQHACKVIPQGRTFLRRMINLLAAFRREDHPIRLNREFHLDLGWWLEFFKSWNGKSFFLSPEWAPLPDFQMSSDASGTIGYGAIFTSHWFTGSWSASQLHLSIAYKELFPIVIAANLWGHLWSSRRAEFLSDNKAVVDILQSGTSKDPNLMILLRYLLLMAARHSFTFTATHVQGKSNHVADALSRFQFQRFRQLAPHADQVATTVPQSVVKELVGH